MAMRTKFEQQEKFGKGKGVLGGCKQAIDISIAI